MKKPIMYNLAQTGHLSKKRRSAYAIEYFKKRLRRIIQILNSPEDFTNETIHDLRLEIKKIRALFTLLSYYNSNFPMHKYYRPFKTIFKKAGDIRIIQIEHELLKKYISDPMDRYLDELQNLTQKKSGALKEIVKSEMIVKLKSSKRKIRPFLKNVSEKCAKHFLKTNARKLTAFVEGRIFEEQFLHKIRKRLKSFYLIAKATYEDITIPEPWNRLLELLGKWNDEQVTIEHLRKAIYSSQFSQDEVERLYNVKREITVNRENLSDQIVATFFLIESKEGAVSLPDNAVIDIAQ